MKDQGTVSVNQLVHDIALNLNGQELAELRDLLDIAASRAAVRADHTTNRIDARIRRESTGRIRRVFETVDDLVERPEEVK